MIVETINLMKWDVNCYLFGDESTGQVVVIDPGDEAERIIEICEKRNLKIVAIINTHGHGDHIGANREIHEMTGAPIYIGEQDASYLSDPMLNLSPFLDNNAQTSPAAERLLEDGDEIHVGSLTLTVISTPGHTPGGICLSGHGILFSGDTLFAGSVGRWDFPGADRDDLIHSMTVKLMSLPDELVVYPGHGPSTTIGREKRVNPFMRGEGWEF